ncbi:MAG: MATE family efflux transporter, partial [Clostridia bacterium]|nr:MATE family efflux transporter [Clostridia bacterium]
LGTLISRVFEFSIICGYFFLKDKDICYRVKDLFMKCKDMVGDYMRISLPVFISDAMLALGENMVTMIIGRLGASFVSANAITMVTVRLSTVFSQGLSNASAIMTGHTLGMGQVEQAKKQGWTFLGLGALIGLFAGGFIMLTSDLIISFYNINAETQAIARELMLAVGFIVIFQVMNGILTKGVLRGGGDTKFLMVADILFLWIASVPLGYFAGLVWHWPAFGIYTMLKIDQIIKAVWCIFRLKSNKWIKKV